MAISLKTTSTYALDQSDREKQPGISQKTTDAKNTGNALGYLAGNYGLGAFGMFEGTFDLIGGGLSSLFGNNAYAKYLNAKDTTGSLTQKLNDDMKPGKVMQYGGEVAQGMGQSSIFLLGHAGKLLFFTGAWGRATAEAQNTTGKLGVKEYAYGAVDSAKEMALEWLSGQTFTGLNKTKYSLSKGISNLLGTTSKEAANVATRRGVIKTMISEGASEFFEEFLGSYIETHNKHVMLNDPNAEYSLSEALYSGLVGFGSGSIMSGVSGTVRAAASHARGSKIVSEGKTGQVLKNAQIVKDFFKDQKWSDWADSESITRVYHDLVASYEAYNKLSADQVTSDKAMVYLGEMEINGAQLECLAEVGGEGEIVKQHAKKYADFASKFFNETITEDDVKNNKNGIANNIALMRWVGYFDNEETVLDAKNQWIRETIEKNSKKAAEAAQNVAGSEMGNNTAAAPEGSTEGPSYVKTGVTPGGIEYSENSLYNMSTRVYDLGEGRSVVAFQKPGDNGKIGWSLYIGEGTSMVDGNGDSVGYSEVLDDDKIDSIVDDIKKNYDTIMDDAETRKEQKEAETEKKSGEKKTEKKTKKKLKIGNDTVQLATEEDLKKAKIIGDQYKEVTDKLTISQKAQALLLNKMFEGTKYKVLLYSGAGNKGITGAYHGNTIYVDVNSKMLRVTAHELVHSFVKQSPEQYEALKSFVIKSLYEGDEAKLTEAAQEIIDSYKKTSQQLSKEAATEEIVAKSCEEVFGSSKIIKQMLKTDSKLFDAVLTFLDGWQHMIDAAIANYGESNQYLKRMNENAETIKEVRRLFADALKTTYKNQLGDNGSKQENLISKAMEEDTELGAGEVQRTDSGEMIIAESADGSEVFLSYETYNEYGRKRLAQLLKDQGYSKEEVEAAMKPIEAASKYIGNLAKEFSAEGYDALQEHFYASVERDYRGRQILHALVKNGDYPVNIDLSTICKKRVAYTKLLLRLMDSGIFGKVSYDGEAIARVHEILRKYGFETACMGCFVESRRLQIQAWAEGFAAKWNEAAEKLNPGCKYFDWSTRRDNVLMTEEEVLKLETELSEHEKNDKGNVNLGQGSVETRIKKLMKKVPGLQQKIDASSLLDPAGLKAMRGYAGGTNIYSLLLQNYGAATPKIVQEYNAYNSEIADLTFKFAKETTGESVTGADAYRQAAKELLKDSEPKKYTGKNEDRLAEYKAAKAKWDARVEEEAVRNYLFAVGGVRIQSFSDFMIENVFDYYQILTDLAVRGLPMHGYTKEITAMRIFGMSGIKWNGSLIATVSKGMYADADTDKRFAGLIPEAEYEKLKVDGKIPKGLETLKVTGRDGKTYYIGFDDVARNQATKGKTFIQSIGLKDVMALILDKRYSKNCGNITIGVSDEQILAMIRSPYFRMVIPYHKSGMLPEYAALVGVDMYNDYEDYQETKVEKLYDKNGKLIAQKSQKKYVDAKGKEVTKTVKDLIKKVPTHFDFNEAANRLGNAKAAADEYLAWCADRNNHVILDDNGDIEYIAECSAKFSNSPYGYDFTKEENYYKLLEDFNEYDLLDELSDKKTAALQDSAKMILPGQDGTRLSEKELKEYAQRLRDTGIFTEDDIKKYVERANWTDEDIIRHELEGRAQYTKQTDGKFELAYKETYGMLMERERTGNAITFKKYKEKNETAKEARKKGIPNYGVNPPKGTYRITAEDAFKLSFEEIDDEYDQAVKENNESRMAELVKAAAEKAMPNSRIRTKDGKLRIVYHGTNTGDFTVFDPKTIGMSSGDNGFFGKGFYFAFNKGEAEWYGHRRIIPAYLNIQNPFDFRKELQYYKGKLAGEYAACDAIVYMNFAEKFPEIADKITITAFKNDEEVKIPLKQFAKEYKEILENKKFEYKEIKNEYGEINTEAFADAQQYEYEGNKWTDYGFKKTFYGKADPYQTAYYYLKENIYQNINLNNFTYVVLDYSNEFRKALEDKGYDGTIQSEQGDEVVAFYPNQIKSADNITRDDAGNVIPLSERFNQNNEDIRYSQEDAISKQLNSGDEENLIYVKNDANTGRSFIDLILDGKKKGETRTHKRLTRKWVGISDGKKVYGRVRLGDPIEITNKSPEYKDAYIKGTEYDIKDGESKYYYPILEREDFRENPRDIQKHGNYGKYRYSYEDSEYLELAKDPKKNESKLKELVRKAAERAGYQTLLYHGTTAKFNSFDISKSAFGLFGYGFYFDSKRVAEQYGEGNVIEAYVKSDKIADQYSQTITPEQFQNAISALELDPEKTYKFYVDTIPEYLKRRDDHQTAYDLERWASEMKRFGSEKSKDKNAGEILTILRNTLGKDGLQFGGTTVIWDNKLIKSADAVTYDDDGNVIPLSERFNQDNEDIRYSYEDSEYLELAKDVRKNYSKLLKITKASAKRWGAFSADGKSPMTFYHGTLSGEFNVFDKSKADHFGMALGKGFYLTSSFDEAADMYANKDSIESRNSGKTGNDPAVIEAYINSKNMAIGVGEQDMFFSTDPKSKHSLIEFNRLLRETLEEYIEDGIIDEEMLDEYDVHGEDPAGTLLNIWSDGDVDEDGGLYLSDLYENGFHHAALFVPMEDVFNSVIRKMGFNGIIVNFNGNIHAVVFDSELIKSAKVVTYDDAGNIIPLSERFNRKNEDIRYSFENIVGDDGTNYGQGVKLDSDLLDGLTEDQRKTKVKDFIDSIGGYTLVAYDKNGHAVNISIAKKSEFFKNSKNRKTKVNKDLKTKFENNEVRQESIVLINELAEAGKHDVAKASTKSHGWLDNNGKNDWDYWNCYVEDKIGDIYKVTLNVANAVDGRKLLYDIKVSKKVGQAVKVSAKSTTNVNSISQKQSDVNTNILNFDSDGKKLSEGQQEFFKDSNVRDDQGRLLKVYHGTADGGFTKFYTPAWFSNSKIYADGFEDWKSGKHQTYEVYLNIKNPYIIDAQNAVFDEIDIDGETYSTDDIVFKAHQSGEYDGVIIKNVEEGWNKIVDDYIPFESNQIKLTDNLSPTEDEDIRYDFVEEDKNITKEMEAARKLLPSFDENNWNTKISILEFLRSAEGTKADKDTLSAISSIISVSPDLDVRFIDGTESGSIHRSETGDTLILLDKGLDSAQAIRRTLSSEIIHMSENTETYGKFARLVLGSATEEDQNAVKEKYTKYWNDKGIEVTDEALLKECVSELGADMLRDRDLVAQWSKKNKALPVRLAEAAKDLARKLFGKNRDAYKEASRLSSILQSAVVENSIRKATGTPGVQWSLGKRPENQSKTRQEILDEARELHFFTRPKSKHKILDLVKQHMAGYFDSTSGSNLANTFVRDLTLPQPTIEIPADASVKVKGMDRISDMLYQAYYNTGSPRAARKAAEAISKAIMESTYIDGSNILIKDVLNERSRTLATITEKAMADKLYESINGGEAYSHLEDIKNKYDNLMQKIRRESNTREQELRDDIARAKGIMKDTLMALEQIRRATNQIKSPSKFKGILASPQMETLTKVISSAKSRGGFLINENVRGAIQAYVDFFANQDNQRGMSEEAELMGIKKEAARETYEACLEAIKNFPVSGENAMGEVLTDAEIETFTDVARTVAQLYRTYNKYYDAKRKEWIDADAVADQGITNTLKMKKLHEGDKKLVKAFKQLWDRYGIEALDPMAAGRLLDGYNENGVMASMMSDIVEAENAKELRIQKYMKPVDDFISEHKDFEKHLTSEEDKVEFRGQKLTRDEFIQLYMTTFRKQALFHFGFGRMEFGTREGRDGLRIIEPALQVDKDWSSYMKEEGLSIEDFQQDCEKILVEIRNLGNKVLTKEDREYIKLMENFYNNVSTQDKKKMDMTYFGMTNVIEDETDMYVPIKTSMSSRASSVTDERNAMANFTTLSGQGFNKNTVKGAKNPMVFTGAYSLMKEHANGLAAYVELYAAMQKLDRVWSTDVNHNPQNSSRLRDVLSDTYGDNVEKYVRSLMGDIQGINTKKPNAWNPVIGRMRSNYAIFQLGANPKTWFNQLGSMGALVRFCDIDSIAKGLNAPNKEEMSKYSTAAAIREGGDVAVKAQALTDQVSGRVKDLLMKPIGWSDMKIVGMSWGACQYQIEKTKGYAVGTEENLEAAGLLLNKVINESQDTSLASTKTGIARADSELIKGLAMFRSAPFKQFSRLTDAVGTLATLNARSKSGESISEEQMATAKKELARTSAGWTMQAAVGIAISAMFAWLYKKDDDKNPLDYIVDFLSEMISVIPIVGDIYSYFADGYDVSYFAYDMLNDAMDNMKDTVSLVANGVSGKKVTRQQIAKAAYNDAVSIGEFTGIPVRNVKNFFAGITKRISSIFGGALGYSMDASMYEQSYQADLKEALESGNERLAEKVVELLYADKKSTSKLSESAATEVLRLYAAGYTAVLPPSIGNKITVDGVDYEVKAKDQKQIRQICDPADDAVIGLIASDIYKGLSDEEKAKAIGKMYTMYYDRALNYVFGVPMSKTDALSYLGDAKTIISAAAHIQNLKADQDETGKTTISRKSKVNDYIAELGVDEETAELILYAAGYSSDALMEAIANIAANAKLTDKQYTAVATALGIAD